MAASHALLPSPQASGASPARARRACLAASMPPSSITTLAARNSARLRDVRCAVLSSPVAPVAASSEPSKKPPTHQISRSGSDGALWPNPAVLVAEKVSEAGLVVLREFADVECAYCMSPAELLAKVATAPCRVRRGPASPRSQSRPAGRASLRTCLKAPAAPRQLLQPRELCRVPI